MGPVFITMSKSIYYVFTSNISKLSYSKTKLLQTKSTVDYSEQPNVIILENDEKSKLLD